MSLGNREGRSEWASGDAWSLPHDPRGDTGLSIRGHEPINASAVGFHLPRKPIHELTPPVRIRVQWGIHLTQVAPMDCVPARRTFDKELLMVS